MPGLDLPFPTFVTFVAGSLPRPQWIRELIEDGEGGVLDEAYLKQKALSEGAALLRRRCA